MENDLTTLQLQEMLREMGVKFSAAASHETLSELLRTENRKKWLGLDEDGEVAPKKRVIKRRAKHKDTVIIETAERKVTRKDENIIIDNPLEPGFKERSHNERLVKPEARVEIVPEHLKNPNNIATYKKTNRNVEDLVFKRAGGICELCEDENSLELCHIIKAEDGGENNVKNIVGLCEKCRSKQSFSRSEIKNLKRKARSRITRDVAVVYKKK